jgi:hypothetical protein
MHVSACSQAMMRGNHSALADKVPQFAPLQKLAFRHMETLPSFSDILSSPKALRNSFP